MIIGITGGIGSGKSTAAAFFKNKGYKIIDADAISREVTSKESDTLRILVNHFGETLLNADKSLNRKLLSSIIFNDENEKKYVEDLILTRIIEISKSRLNGDSIFDAPTLFENHLEYLVDVTILITADEDIRIKRAMERDGKTEDEIVSIINNQMPEDKKILLSDYVVYNNKDIDYLNMSLEEVYKEILKC